MAWFMNYGTGEPPYHYCMFPGCVPARGLPPGVHLRSEEHIKIDAVYFAVRVLKTRAPTMVVIDSSLWDLANWWNRAGRPQATYVNNSAIEWWCHKGYPQMLQWVLDAFPTSTIVYRTIPTIVATNSSHGRSPEAIAQMDACLRSELGGKFHAIDYRQIVQSRLDAGISPTDIFLKMRKDGVHPDFDTAALYANAAMEYVAGMSITPPR